MMSVLQEPASAPVTITESDLDFVDGIALLSTTMEQARYLLLSVEECLKVGLQLNTKKTKVPAYNIIKTAVRKRDRT